MQHSSLLQILRTESPPDLITGEWLLAEAVSRGCVRDVVEDAMLLADAAGKAWVGAACDSLGNPPAPTLDDMLDALPADAEETCALAKAALDVALSASNAPRDPELIVADGAPPMYRYVHAARGWIPTMNATPEDIAHGQPWLLERVLRARVREGAARLLGTAIRAAGCSTVGELLEHAEGDQLEALRGLVHAWAHGETP